MNSDLQKEFIINSIVNKVDSQNKEMIRKKLFNYSIPQLYNLIKKIKKFNSNEIVILINNNYIQNN